MNKTERFIEANLGTNSSFYEMLMHLCEDPQDAMGRDVPIRLANQLEYVLKNVINNTKN